MHFSCSINIFQQEIDHIAKKAHQKLYFCCRDHYFICTRARVEFHLKHKHASDFKSLCLSQCKCRKENNPVILALGHIDGVCSLFSITDRKGRIYY